MEKVSISSKQFLDTGKKGNPLQKEVDKTSSRWPFVKMTVDTTFLDLELHDYIRG